MSGYWMDLEFQMRDKRYDENAVEGDYTRYVWTQTVFVAEK